MKDLQYMLYGIDLAKRANGANLSNPMVGAVLVHNKTIIGQGYHEVYGGPHAEINALNSVSAENKKFIPDSTLYVTLEPCSHHGKTPPCCDAIIKYAIPKVVIGCPDPNPMVSGRGIQKLKDAGIEVELSALVEEANVLIRPFRAHLAKRPYIILKCVKSRDHFMGKQGQQVWLSNDLTTHLSHVWRSQIDGILVGKNTVITDNPLLTVRGVTGKNPVRIVLDPNLSCPLESAIFRDNAEVIVFNNVKESQHGHIMYKLIEPGAEGLHKAVSKLFDLGIHVLLVEGGAQTLKGFISADLWDEARVIDTPHLLGDGIPAPNIEGRLDRKINIKDDCLTVIVREVTPRPT